MKRSPNFNNYSYQRNDAKTHNYSRYGHAHNNSSLQFGGMKYDMRPTHPPPNYLKWNNYNKAPQTALPTPPPPPPLVPQPLMSAAAARDEAVYFPRVHKKAKKKTMSTRVCKGWVREDAIKALELENEYLKSTSKAPILLLRFPDPEINRTIVEGYSPEIESVHFQLNAAPRYCFVHLKEGTDAEKVIETISKIPFGTGFVSAELRRTLPAMPNPSNPEDVDPYTLYVGNLISTISSHTVKEHFPSASRVDIGFAQRMKGTRYAFVRYDSVEKAMEGFKNSINSVIESRSLIVRFLRKKGQTVAEHPSKRSQEESEIDISAVTVNDPTPRLAEENATNDTIPPITQEESSSSSKKVRLSTPTNAIVEVRSQSSPDIDNSIETNANVNESEKDSKENVITDAERLRETMHSGRDSALDHILFEENNSQDNNVNTENALISSIMSGTGSSNSEPRSLQQNVEIKQEITEDDLSEEENLPNLLGARYSPTNMCIKRESEENSNIDDVLRNNNIQDSVEYDEEFDESEAEDEHWSSMTQKLKQMKHSPVFQLKQKEEPDTYIDTKPSLSELNDELQENIHCSNIAGENIAEHSSFVKKLYEEVKRTKEAEKGKRPRDELDDLFAQMNSDNEDYSDDAF